MNENKTITISEDNIVKAMLALGCNDNQVDYVENIIKQSKQNRIVEELSKSNGTQTATQPKR